MRFIPLALLLSAVASLHAQNAVTRSLFDPDAYTPLNGGSALVLQAGDTLAIDTSALTITRNGASLGSGVAGSTGGPSPQSVALFTFTSLTIPSGVTVAITGTRPLGLLARENLSIGSAIDVSASGTTAKAGGAAGGAGSVAGNPGGGAGGGQAPGSSRSEGGGGSYGGQGESLTGATYGDAALTDLHGGSGGGSGSGYDAGLGGSAPGRSGGAGAGALLFQAQNNLQVSAALTAKGGTGVTGNNDQGSGGGGSGGAILLAAPHVSVSSTVNADGGTGGYFTSPGFVSASEGGGGRIALYSISAPTTATLQARRPNIIATGGFPPTTTTYAASGTIFRSTTDEPSFAYPASAILQPQISGMRVTGTTETTTTLQADIRPGAIPATAVFEYGTTTAYGSTVAVALSPDSGTALQTATATISGLQPLTLYHFRLKATNSSQVTPGADATFFTPGSPVFNSAADTPVTLNGFTATGLTINPVLNFAPASGAVITLVNNTSGSPITGELANIADKGSVVITHNGGAYTFTASYFGGDGNDLVLILPGPGVLDYTFGKAGKVTQAVGTYEGARAVAVQADGKIVVGGNSQIGGAPHDYVVLRFTSDGVLDTTFNGTGITSSPIGADDDTVSAMALQSDGRILLAGNVELAPAVYDFALARFNTNGSLDPTFNGTGKVTTDLGGSLDLLEDMVMQPDGKIIVVGQSNNGSVQDWALVRYNTDGSLDSGLAGDSTPGDSFGTGGKVFTDQGGNSETAKRVAVQPDGKIVVAGSATNGTNVDFGIARYHANGNLDTTFNATGKVVTSVGTGNDNCNGMALLPDGKILLCGNTSGTNTDTVLVRYNANGSLDTTFNGTGKLIVSLYTNDSANELAIQPDGKIVARVSANTGSSSSNRYGLARFFAGGSLDTSFGGTGFVTTNVSGGAAGDMAIQPDGQILLAGGTSSTSTPGDYAVLRYDAGLNPEINVELTGLGALTDGGHTVDYGLVFPGAPVARTFTVRNSGFSDLTGLGITFSGAGAGDYSVGISPVAPVTGPTGSSTFTVVFNPATAGVKGATLHLASNDANEASFDIGLTGRALLPEGDDDADGMNNAAEVTLAAAGFDPLTDSTPLIATLRNTGLYQAADFQALALGRPMLERSPTTGNFHLRLGLKQSGDLLNWTPLTGFLPTYDSGTGLLDLEIAPPGNGPHFFQVFGEEP